MKNLTRVVFILSLLLIVLACNKKAEQKGSMESTKKKTDLSNQVNYEKFIADWGIALHEKATFKGIKKTNDGCYKIFYTVEPFENILDSLQNYYEKMFDVALLDNEWTKPKSGWNPHGTMYEKDNNYFKFFLVISEEHNVYELAFKFGE